MKPVFDEYGFPCGDIINHYPHIENEDAQIYMSSNSNRIFYSIGSWSMCGANTKIWCEKCNMSEENTLIWVIKYGDTLPKYKEDLEDIHMNLGDMGI
jgi:hypothetical protein